MRLRVIDKAHTSKKYGT